MRFEAVRINNNAANSRATARSITRRRHHHPSAGTTHPAWLFLGSSARAMPTSLPSASAGGFAAPVREQLARLVELGYEEPTLTGRSDPPAADRRRPARPSRHRHRQDGVRPPIIETIAPNSPAVPQALVVVLTANSPSRSAAMHTYGRDQGLKVGRGQPIPRQLQAPAAACMLWSPPSAGRSTIVAARSNSMTSAPSCSTRPTKCSTWASPRTSRRSSRKHPPNDRRCCSPQPCRPDPEDRRDLARQPGAREDRRRRHGRRTLPCSPNRRGGASAQGQRTRPRPRHGSARRHHRLPHPGRGRRTHRHDERLRVPPASTARWISNSATES